MLAMAQGHEETRLIGELHQIRRLTVKRAEPLARYTSIKIGGPADYYVEAADESALASLLQLLQRGRTEYCVLGNGSNVLISDRGIRGVVIRLTGEFRRVEWQEEGLDARLNAGAACAVTQLVREAARRGYTGLEFAEGIPGSVGGAVFMNAGAYGSEFEKVVAAVEVMTSRGEPLCLSRQEIVFSYRDAHLPYGTVVTGVMMRLQKGEARQVGAQVRELVDRRKGSQPSGFPNSGSMFRNPPGDFAGRLIEAAGLKGKRVGQCEISSRHANFIVNLGGATAGEVRRLMVLAQLEVRRQFGVDLVPEVKILGDWAEE